MVYICEMQLSKTEERREGGSKEGVKDIRPEVQFLTWSGNSSSQGIFNF